MFRTSKLALVACAVAATAISAADAADMPAPVVPAEVMSGWYLRGDIGYANQQVDELFNALYDTAVSVDNQFKDFTGAPFIDAGIGYRFNHWFRVDVTGEYRSRSEFNGADIYDSGAGLFPDTYTGQKSEWLALANAYVDLGTWHGITPFVGAGLGAVNIRISDFTDSGVGTTGDPAIAYADDHDEWNLAWAIYAGLGFDVTDALTLELAYRYLDMGDAASGDLCAYDDPTCGIDNPMEFHDVTSHDVRLGMRYAFW
jgi:opacity protein-like surface antigen